MSKPKGGKRKTLGFGIRGHLGKLLSSHPNARWIRLDRNGGYIVEGNDGSIEIDLSMIPFIPWDDHSDFVEWNAPAGRSTISVSTRIS